MDAKEIYKSLGAIQALKYIRATTDAANVLIFQQIKESKLYKAIDYNSWEDFCKTELGISYKTADEAIANLKAFGAELYNTANQIGITARQFKQLRSHASDIELNQSEGVVKIGNEIIPLTPASADDLHEAINNLLDEKTTEIERLEKTVKSKDQLLELKDKTLKIAESEVKELTQKTKPTPDESVKALKSMKARMELDMRTLDPEEPLLSLHTVASKAEYAAMVTWLYKEVTALYEHAADAYGFSADGWTPPNE